MSSNENRTLLKKAVLILLALVVFGGVMLVLNHTAQNGRKTTEHLPTLMDVPVYVECEKGKPLDINIHTDAELSISGVQVFLVNLDENSRGTLKTTIQDSDGNVLAEQLTPVGTITPGEWFLIPSELQLLAETDYKITFLTDDSEPYFMQVPDCSAADFPFTFTVMQNNQAVDTGLSFGMNTVVPENITFGDIFYYSRLFAVIALLGALLLIIAGKDRVMAWIAKIPFPEIVRKFGNEIFLVLLFACLCLGIIVHAYLKGAYITADSTGYMREAVNLVAGNGFGYDQLAGYQSWFANWPIIYPLLIAGIMLVTGTNAYLGSKLLTMLVIALILVVLRCYYKKDAWFYALCLTNIGFVLLTYYTWSEIPYMLILLCFGLVLSRILKQDDPSVKLYVLLGISGLACFLTRYIGIYVWLVVGLYLLILFCRYRRTQKDILLFRKMVWLAGTAFVSGVLSISYMLVNRLKNGRVTGVSRGLWWDDYRILTDDLIETLLKEFFNIFSVQVPQVIDELPYNLKVFFLLALLVGLIWLIVRNCKHFTTESVFITLAVSYYLIFIAIRYVSSMDTFYFRFFEPASFLLSLGLFGLLLPMLRNRRAFGYFAGAVTLLLLLRGVFYISQISELRSEDSYYESLTASWDQAYAEIPQKSVIIFSNMDFRSSYYRPDVVEGTISPGDTFESLQATYYGSEHLCIRGEDARVMLGAGEYDESIQRQLRQGLEACGAEDEYVVIALH